MGSADTQSKEWLAAGELPGPTDGNGPDIRTRSFRNPAKMDIAKVKEERLHALLPSCRSRVKQEPRVPVFREELGLNFGSMFAAIASEF